jgi:hypothetical protein
MLVGCGQAEPPDADQDYFPLADGARWIYLHSAGAWEETVTVSEGDAPDEMSMHASADPDGRTTTQVLLRDGDDTLRIGKDDRIDDMPEQNVEYDPGFLRFSKAWLDREPGSTDQREYLRTETLAGMDPKAANLRAHIFTVESVSERVTVPAGTFQSCLRVRRERDLSNPDLTGTFATEEQEKLYWFCPGVGKTREENLLTGSTEVLLEYTNPDA